MTHEILVIPQHMEYIESRLKAAKDYFKVTVLHRDIKPDQVGASGSYFDEVGTIALYVPEDGAISYRADILAQTVGKHHDVSKTPKCVYFIVQHIHKLDNPIPVGETTVLTHFHFYTNWEKFNSATTMDDLPLKE